MGKVIDYTAKSVAKHIDTCMHHEDYSVVQTKLVVYASLSLLEQKVEEAKELLSLLDVFTAENLQSVDLEDEMECLTKFEVLLFKHFYDMKHDIESAYDMTMLYNRHWVDFDGKLI